MRAIGKDQAAWRQGQHGVEMTHILWEWEKMPRYEEARADQFAWKHTGQKPLVRTLSISKLPTPIVAKSWD